MHCEQLEHEWHIQILCLETDASEVKLTSGEVMSHVNCGNWNK